MSLVLSKQQYLLNNVEIISQIFLIAEEKTFALNYFTEKQYNRCLNAGKTNLERVNQFLLLICTKGQQFAYDGLIDYFEKKASLCLKVATEMNNSREINKLLKEKQNDSLSNETKMDVVEQIHWPFMVEEMKECLHDMRKLANEQDKLSDIGTNEIKINSFSHLMSEKLNKLKDENKIISKELKKAEKRNYELTLENDKLRRESQSLQLKNKVQKISRGSSISNSFPMMNNRNDVDDDDDEVMTPIPVEVPNVKPLPIAFKKEPTKKMEDIKRSFRYFGLSPQFCNKYGEYPFVNWQIMDTSYDISRAWTDILKRNSGYLYFPPIILPTEMGGWLTNLSLVFDSGLKLRGFIFENDHNQSCPPYINLYMIIKIFIAGQDKPIIAQGYATLNKYNRSYGQGFYNLMSICDDVDFNCGSAMPSAQLRLTNL